MNYKELLEALEKMKTILDGMETSLISLEKNFKKIKKDNDEAHELAEHYREKYNKVIRKGLN